MHPVKPALTLDEQCARLVERGLVVADQAVVKRALLDGNYYRMSGYFRQFQTAPGAGDNSFEPGTRIEDVVEAIAYDRAFSSHLLVGVMRIEQVVRSRLAYHLAQHFGHLAFYLDPDHYLPAMPNRDGHLQRIEDELLRSKSPTVPRYARGRNLSEVPVWVAIELMSFGSVSKMLQYIQPREAAKAVAQDLSLVWEGFETTVHSLAVLRNRCAHHGQLWHRRLDVQTPLRRTEKRHWPTFDPQGPMPAALAVIRFLRAIDRNCPDAKQLHDFLHQDIGLRAGILDPRPR